MASRSRQVSAQAPGAHAASATVAVAAAPAASNSRRVSTGPPASCICVAARRRALSCRCRSLFMLLHPLTSLESPFHRVSQDTSASYYLRSNLVLDGTGWWTSSAMVRDTSSYLLKFFELLAEVSA